MVLDCFLDGLVFFCVCVNGEMEKPTMEPQQWAGDLRTRQRSAENYPSFTIYGVVTFHLGEARKFWILRQCLGWSTGTFFN